MHHRTIIISALALFLAMNVGAQPSRWEAGVQVGPSLGSLRGNRLIDASEALIGTTGALALEYRITERWSMHGAVGHQRKGCLSTLTLTDLNGTVVRTTRGSHKLDYITIPLLLRASFGERSRLFAGAGVYAGYLIKGTKAIDAWGNPPYADVTGELTTLDLGLSASLGWSIALGEKLALQAEVRYDHGLSNISDLPVMDDGAIYTRTIAPTLGCSYQFGGSALQ